MELTKERIAQLSKLPTGNVADNNPDGGVMDAGIVPLDTTLHMIGRAVTVKCSPGDNLALHQGIYAAKAGDVLVFDCGGYTHGGHFGDMMATACQVRGIAGVIIDGTCRDREDIKAIHFPVYSRGTCPAGTVKETLARINVPVNVGGVTVHPGDLIFADGDGVVVIPQEQEDIVMEKALAKYEKEQKIIEMLKEGKTTLEIYGFDRLIESKTK